MAPSTSEIDRSSRTRRGERSRGGRLGSFVSLAIAAERNLGGHTPGSKLQVMSEESHWRIIAISSVYLAIRMGGSSDKSAQLLVEGKDTHVRLYLVVFYIIVMSD